MVPLINKKKEFQGELYQRILGSLRDFSNGSEWDLGSEKVIIRTTRFCKVVTGFLLGMWDPKLEYHK